MSSSKQKMPIMENNKVKVETWLEIFGNKTLFRILQLLFVYGELNLTNLSKHMDMSKSALYHHLKKLTRAGVIKVSREKKVRGSIKAKFYALDKQTALRIQLISVDDLLKIDDPKKLLKLLKSIINTYRSSFSLFKSKINMLDCYTSFLVEKVNSCEDSSSDSFDILNLMLDYDINFHAQYLTETQYKKFIGYSHEFYTKVNEMIFTNNIEEIQEHNEPIEHPYFVLSMAMPLKKMLDLELKG
ncbi:MAG: ArsR/SmtB family transcription factor [Promethearchaeota archaeon]